MANHDYIKLPRLYVDQELKEKGIISFPPEQLHYLKNVMRRKQNDRLRLFNGKDGEWLASIENIEKRTGSAKLDKQLLKQPTKIPVISLIFSPIKKNRMDFLIEKATELGVTQFCPVICEYTEVRKMNENRIRAQIIEAAEQCERLDIPGLSSPLKLDHLIGDWQHDKVIHACIERKDSPFIGRSIKEGDLSLLIGPEGGFSEREINLLDECSFIDKVSLGKQILRSETAALFSLSIIKALNDD